MKYWLGVGLAGLLLAGCGTGLAPGATSTPTPSPVVAGTPLKKEFIEPILKLDKPLESDLVDEQTRLTGELLKKGAYVEVDALMTQLYEGKVLAVSGTPRLLYLLDRLARPDMLENALAWQKESPRSVWAHIVSGVAAQRASVKLKGRRSASELSQEDSDKIWALSKAGRDSVAQAQKLQPNNVYVPWSQLRLLSFTAAEPAEIQDALTRAIGLQADFFPAYQLAASYYARQKDDQALQALLAPLDDAMLARIDTDTWSDMDWKRAKPGFEALRKQYPTSTMILNQYACAAVKNSDSAAKSLLTEVGDRYDHLAWRSFSSFQDARSKYLGATATPSGQPVNNLVPIDVAPPGYWQDEAKVKARLIRDRSNLARLKARLAEAAPPDPETKKLQTELDALESERDKLREQLFQKEGTVW